jgi:ABC-type Fe3+-hydroxamate transport system substrate-binding protein
VAIDWGLAETLVALGAPPLGLAESRGYREWVSQPAMPDSVAEIGLRSTPNLEYIAALRPDVILSTPQFAAIDPVLASVAPVLSLATYTEALSPYRNATDITRQLGALLGRQEEAESLIADTEERIAQLARSLEGTPSRKVLVVNFHDDRHAWIHTKGSLFDDVLTRAGLENAWEGPGNAWGIANGTVDQLAGMDEAALLIVEPLALVIQAKLETRDPNGLLGQLPIFEPGRYRILPPIWGFGALPAAGRFADALGELDGFLKADDAF